MPLKNMTSFALNISCFWGSSPGQVRNFHEIFVLNVRTKFCFKKQKNREIKISEHILSAKSSITQIINNFAFSLTGGSTSVVPYERMSSYPGTGSGSENYSSSVAIRPSDKNCQTDLTIEQMKTKSAESDAKDNRIDELSRMNDELSRHLTTRNKELDEKKGTISKCLNVVKDLLIEKSNIERKDARAKCMQNRLRLGQFVTQRVGATFQENWTDGYGKLLF